VELHADTFTLSFPPPDEKWFYEGDDAPIQHIVQSLRKIPQYHPRLNQYKQDLKLSARITTVLDDRERLSSLKKFFNALKN
ncbi:MAG TPA: hypothetical protein VMU30_12725, partial [Bacteroidota bacterium]|nr:hypothetical protein [Bacteroidota bacterium]